MHQPATARKQLMALIEQGRIPAEHIDDALAITHVQPDALAWRRFIDRALLWVGALALAAAVLFFVAYNWNDIGRFAKFGLLEGLIALAFGIYWKRDDDSLGGQLSLLVASILLGILLALFGQTYQTGADTWQLFFSWAMLILPWVLISRFPALWLLWLTLINLSILLHQQVSRDLLGIVFNNHQAMLWPLFLFNLMALVVWERQSLKLPWLKTHWATRLLAVGSGVPITWLALAAIFGNAHGGLSGGLMWGIWLAGMFVVYRKIKLDLFMLAGGCLSAIVVIVTFTAQHMTNSGVGSLLLISLLIVGLGSGAAIWLRNLQRELQP